MGQYTSKHKFNRLEVAAITHFTTASIPHLQIQALIHREKELAGSYGSVIRDINAEIPAVLETYKEKVRSMSCRRGFRRILKGKNTRFG